MCHLMINVLSKMIQMPKTQTTSKSLKQGRTLRGEGKDKVGIRRGPQKELGHYHHGNSAFDKVILPRSPNGGPVASVTFSSFRGGGEVGVPRFFLHQSSMKLD
jgi:hypothetical protein